ncbi:hypothetical protein AB0M95_02360 [Sphaerisporangium sp. NPDC051017]|uniref:hypothetical protein n=1 Tax=Sphaerisporangium sp. NPDC051017 TaxID=3154636 RepID=UPI00342C5C17
MTRHRADDPLVSLAWSTTRLATAVLLIGLVGAVASSPAEAWASAAGHAVSVSTGSGDHGQSRFGNGKYNSLYVQVNSPTFMRGIQHKSNAAVQGSAPSQAAFCKKKQRVCNIWQFQKMNHSRHRSR